MGVMERSDCGKSQQQQVGRKAHNDVDVWLLLNMICEHDGNAD